MVGSSSTSRFDARANSRASSSRDRSPPDKRCRPAPRSARDRTGIPSDSPGRASCAPRTSIQSPPSASTSRTRLSGDISLRCWSMTMPRSVLACVTVPSSGFNLAGQQLEQRGLAGAVGADQADPVAALDAQGEVLDDRAVAERLGDHVRRRSPSWSSHRPWRGRAWPSPAGPSIAARWARISFSFASRPWLRLRRAVTPRCSQCSSSFSLASSLSAARCFLGIDRLGPGLEPAKADLGPAQRAPVEPQAALGQAGQEGAVVADDDEGALEALQPVFEPVDRAEIEMVGRLVEQQHVGILRQRADDRRPPPFAAAGGVRRRATRSMPIWSAMAAASCAAGAPSPDSTQSSSVEWPRHVRILLQQHDLGAGHDLALALVGLDQAGEAFQQGRLARAIAADQRQPVARPDDGRRDCGTASLRPGSGQGLRRTGLGVPLPRALA